VNHNSKRRTIAVKRIQEGLGAILLILVSTVWGWAQVEASITGMVMDSSGAAVAGATVTVRNLETNLSRTTSTGEAGRYNVPSLPVGRYEVEAALPAF
jgi:protocatechuate 3,4-dioxygenase beta subunit